MYFAQYVTFPEKILPWGLDVETIASRRPGVLDAPAVAADRASLIVGRPGNASSHQGERAVGYTSGHPDLIEGDPDFVRALEHHLDAPGQFEKHIPVYAGHYALVVASNDGGCACLIADPFGSEPIYYARTMAGYAWSFLLKDILPCLDTRHLDSRGLDEIVSYRWLSEDHTLLDGVRQVLPGHYVYLSSGQPPIIGRYTQIAFTPSLEVCDESAVIEQTSKALDNYFARLRRSHSRIAILFSGGVDSSLLVANARDHGFDKLLAVTAGLPGRPNPEAARAAMVAAHLGVEHRIVDVPDSFVADFFGKLIWQLERPSAYINNLARARMFEQLSSQVDCALTGEGADGMFGGSSAGKMAVEYEAQQTFIAWMPQSARHALADLFGGAKGPMAARLHHYLSVDTRAFIREKGTLATAGAQGAMQATTLFPDLAAIRAANTRPFYSIYEGEADQSLYAICQNRGLHSQNRNQFYCYSKLAAPHGITVGHPFVAPEMAAIGIGLPDALKWDSLGTKPVLKKLATRYLPKDLVYASKLGFEMPAIDWLRGPLAPWYDLLLEERTLARGLFSEVAIHALDVERDHDLIWTAMSLELFMRQFIDMDSGFS